MFRIKKIRLPASIDNVLYYLISIFLVITSNTIYIANNFMLLSIGAVSFIALCLFIFMRKSIKIPNVLFFALIWYIVAICGYLALRFNDSMQSIYTLLLAFPIFFIIIIHIFNVGEQSLFFKSLSDVIFFISIISLFFWLFGSISGFVLPTGNVNLMWGGEVNDVPTYYNIYFEPQRNDWNFAGVRLGTKNCAIFAEAPMASFMFCMGILINEYLVDCKSCFRRNILIASVLSVQSVTGYIFITLFIVSKIISLKPKTNNNKWGKYILLLIVSLVAVIVIFIVLKYKLNTASGDVRSNVIITELQAFLKNPIIGNGFNMYSNGSSNSVTALLADGGLLLWGVYYFPILGVLIYDIIVKHRLNCFVLLFTSVFIVTAVQYLLVTILFISIYWIAFIQRIIYHKSDLLSDRRKLKLWYPL